MAKYFMKTKVYLMMVQECENDYWFSEKPISEVFTTRESAESYERTYHEVAKEINPERVFRSRIVEKNVVVYGDEVYEKEEV